MTIKMLSSINNQGERPLQPAQSPAPTGAKAPMGSGTSTGTAAPTPTATTSTMRPSTTNTPSPTVDSAALSQENFMHAMQLREDSPDSLGNMFSQMLVEEGQVTSSAIAANAANDSYMRTAADQAAAHASANHTANFIQAVETTYDGPGSTHQGADLLDAFGNNTNTVLFGAGNAQQPTALARQALNTEGSDPSFAAALAALAAQNPDATMGMIQKSGENTYNVTFYVPMAQGGAQAQNGANQGAMAGGPGFQNAAGSGPPVFASLPNGAAQTAGPQTAPIIRLAGQTTNLPAQTVPVQPQVFMQNNTARGSEPTMMDSLVNAFLGPAFGQPTPNRPQPTTAGNQTSAGDQHPGPEQDVAFGQASDTENTAPEMPGEGTTLAEMHSDQGPGASLSGKLAQTTNSSNTVLGQTASGIGGEDPVEVQLAAGLPLPFAGTMGSRSSQTVTASQSMFELANEDKLPEGGLQQVPTFFGAPPRQQGGSGSSATGSQPGPMLSGDGTAAQGTQTQGPTGSLQFSPPPAAGQSPPGASTGTNRQLQNANTTASNVPAQNPEALPKGTDPTQLAFSAGLPQSFPSGRTSASSKSGAPTADTTLQSVGEHGADGAGSLQRQQGAGPSKAAGAEAPTLDAGTQGQQRSSGSAETGSQGSSFIVEAVDPRRGGNTESLPTDTAEDASLSQLFAGAPPAARGGRREAQPETGLTTGTNVPSRTGSGLLAGGDPTQVAYSAGLPEQVYNSLIPAGMRPTHGKPGATTAIQPVSSSTVSGVTNVQGGNDGSPQGQFRELQVQVTDNFLPSDLPTDPHGSSIIWAALINKAWAKALDMGMLNGVNEPLSNVTGRQVTVIDGQSVTAEELFQALSLSNPPLKVPVTLTTNKDTHNTGLMSNRTYTVVSTSLGRDGEPMVKLNRPDGMVGGLRVHGGEAFTVHLATIKGAILTTVIADGHPVIELFNWQATLNSPLLTNCCLYAKAAAAGHSHLNDPLRVLDTPTRLQEHRCLGCAFARSLCMPR